MSAKKREEEERFRREEAEKKAREVEEKRKRMEEAEKRRQAMTQKLTKNGENCGPEIKKTLCDVNRQLLNRLVVNIFPRFHERLKGKE